MLAYEPANVANLGSPKSTATGQPDRVEPELGNAIAALDMNVGRLVTAARVEEEPIWPHLRTVGIGRAHALLNLV
jgi:hypothetical protein